MDIPRYETTSKHFDHPGKDTGPETLTEQEYLPTAVQVQRFFNAGDILQAQKKALYDIGWDEDFNINTIPISPERRKNFGMVEAQEELEGAVDRLKEAQANARAEPDVTPGEPEETPETDSEASETEE